MRTIVLDGESLGFADLRALARDFLQRDVRLRAAPAALKRMRRSRAEPDRFPRYPRIPVMGCPGFEEREHDG